MKHSTLNKSLLLTKVELNLVFSTDACRGEFLLELIWRSEWRGSPSTHWSSQMKTQGGWREREIRVFLQFCIRNNSFFESRNHKLCKGLARKPHLLIDSIEDWKREGR